MVLLAIRLKRDSTSSLKSAGAMKIYLRPPESKSRKDDVEVDLNPDELIESVRKKIQETLVVQLTFGFLGFWVLGFWVCLFKVCFFFLRSLSPDESHLYSIHHGLVGLCLGFTFCFHSVSIFFGAKKKPSFFFRSRRRRAWIVTR